MATLETQQLDEVIASSRRRMLAMGGLALAGLALTSAAEAQTTAPTLTDNDYLNFALNLEYLEGNYYTLASSGQTLSTAGIGISGTGTSGTVTVKSAGAAACQVPFTSALLQSYAAEIASDEQKHITFLRSALGSLAVAQPNIDLYNSFNALWTAMLAFYANLKLPVPFTATTFDPFANDLNFLLGAYIFEVGVGAYSGAAPLLTVPANLNAAAGIQATESYHYGLIRTQIVGMDQLPTTLGPAGAAGMVTEAISAMRSVIDGSLNVMGLNGQDNYTTLRGDDVGTQGQLVFLNGGTSLPASSIVNATATHTTTTTANGVTTLNAAPPGGTTSGSLGLSFSTANVLSIVYAGGTGGGGFFPGGLNGNIK